MRAVVTGGGTGGHIYPAVAVARAVEERHPGSSVLYIGSSSGQEAKAAEDAGLRFEGFAVSGIAGKGPLDRARALFRFAGATLRCRKILKRFEAQFVVGTGGYAAAPACAAAITLRVPLILHEMNYGPGLVTRLLGRWAYAVTVAEEGTRQFLPSARVVVTGVPVRPEVEALGDPTARESAAAEARESLSLESGRDTLLVFGGSQGSEALNAAVWEQLPALAGRGDLQLVHVTGRRSEQDSRLAAAHEAVEGQELSYRPITYCERMDLLYALADIAVTRAGAGTLAELTAAALPSVLVPYPFASDDHQEANARRLAARGGAVVVSQQEGSARAALEEALRLLGDRTALRKLAKGAGEAYPGRSAEGIVALAEELR